jgi:hypothetical protein
MQGGETMAINTSPENILKSRADYFPRSARVRDIRWVKPPLQKDKNKDGINTLLTSGNGCQTNNTGRR